MRLIKDCVVCGVERTHALVENGTRLSCNVCLTRSWPAAEELSRDAEERTAAIALPVAPAPVLKGDS